MQLKFESIKENPVSLLRRAGYVFQRKEDEEMSFVRVFSRSGYPRFHIYSHLEGSALKQASIERILNGAKVVAAGDTTGVELGNFLSMMQLC